MLRQVKDVMSLTFFERKKFGLFEGAVVLLFAFDSIGALSNMYIDAVSNRFLDRVPSLVSDMYSYNLNDQDSMVEP